MKNIKSIRNTFFSFTLMLLMVLPLFNTNNNIKIDNETTDNITEVENVSTSSDFNILDVEPVIVLNTPSAINPTSVTIDFTLDPSEEPSIIDDIIQIEVINQSTGKLFYDESSPRILTPAEYLAQEFTISNLESSTSYSIKAFTTYDDGAEIQTSFSNTLQITTTYLTHSRVDNINAEVSGNYLKLDWDSNENSDLVVGGSVVYWDAKTEAGQMVDPSNQNFVENSSTFLYSLNQEELTNEETFIEVPAALIGSQYYFGISLTYEVLDDPDNPDTSSKREESNINIDDSFPYFIGNQLESSVEIYFTIDHAGLLITFQTNNIYVDPLNSEIIVLEANVDGNVKNYSNLLANDDEWEWVNEFTGDLDSDSASILFKEVTDINQVNSISFKNFFIAPNGVDWNDNLDVLLLPLDFSFIWPDESLNEEQFETIDVTINSSIIILGDPSLPLWIIGLIVLGSFLVVVLIVLAIYRYLNRKETVIAK